MRPGKWMVMMVTALLAFAVSGAMGAQPDRPLRGAESVKLTPEEQAFLDQTKELHNRIRIAHLELALMEAKDAPEGQIASKAEELYRLQGKLYALRVKNREMARKLWRESARDEWGHGRGRGGGRGMGPGWDDPGMGRHGRRGMGHGMQRGMGPGSGGHGGPGMGRGMRHGMGRGGGHEMGPGLGLEERGLGSGMGPGMGRGHGWRLRERVWESLPGVPEAVEPGMAIEGELED